MSVNPTVVDCVPGAWTQLCQLMPNRKSLILQLIGGTAVLSVNTNVPLQTSNFGVLPCGIFHSCENGNGPGTFRLSETVDGDLVHQAWYGWVQDLSIVPNEGSTAYIPLVAGANVQPFTTSLPQTCFIVVMVANTGPVAPVVSTIQAGILTPLFMQTLADGAGDSAILVVYTYQMSSNADTATIILAGTDVGTLILYFTTGVGLDQQGVGAALGGTLAVSTAGASLFDSEVAVAAAVSLGTVITGAPPVGWRTIPPAVPVVSPDLSVWLLQTAAFLPTIAGVQTVTWTLGAGAISSTGGIVVAAVNTPPIQTTLIAVIESFEVVIPPPAPKRFSVALPRLSPDAIKALNGLLAEMEQYNESKDEGSHHHADHRDGSG